jgi:hypothetical protein
MHDTYATWSAVLDEYEFRLGAFAATLVGGTPPEPRALPDDLGVCPAELRGRATLLVDRQHDVENAIRARLSFLRGAMDSAPPVVAGSFYLDAEA